MKKYNFFLFFILLFSNKTNAQIYPFAGIGLNFATLVYDNDRAEEVISLYRQPKIGINLSAGINYTLNEGLDIKWLFLYSQKGLRFVQPTHLGITDTYYLQTEFLGSVKLYVTKKYNIFTAVGPQFSYWLYGFYKRKDYITGEYDKQKIDFWEYNENNINDEFEYNRLDAGIIVSAGVSFSEFTLMLKYDYGLISNDKENIDGSKNRVFSINILYNFLKK